MSRREPLTSRQTPILFVMEVQIRAMQILGITTHGAFAGNGTRVIKPQSSLATQKRLIGAYERVWHDTRAGRPAKLAGGKFLQIRQYSSRVGA